jgi:hypothetical protein
MLVAPASTWIDQETCLSEMMAILQPNWEKISI